MHLIGCLTTDAFGLETIAARSIFDGDQIRDLEVERKNLAKEIVQEFTIATNDVTSRCFAAEKLPSIQLVLSAPKRWDRIVTLAQEHASCRLARIRWRLMRCSSKPKPLLRFPDPSFAVTRLLRAGEYTSERPDDMAPGHLGLAAKDYAYSTAPKRRYTSLITQRLLEAAIASRWTRCTGKHFATEENAALHSIVIVSGRPDIEVRLDSPGQLLGFARLFGRAASRHVKRRDKGISTYLNVASLYSKWREPAIFAFGRALAKVPHHNGSLMVLTSSIVGMRHDS